MFDKESTKEIIKGLKKPTWIVDEKYIDPEIKELQGKLEKIGAKVYSDIMAQREEILSAFIAKYGLHPDECLQKVQQNRNETLWWVEKK